MRQFLYLIKNKVYHSFQAVITSFTTDISQFPRMFSNQHIAKVSMFNKSEGFVYYTSDGYVYYTQYAEASRN